MKIFYKVPTLNVKNVVSVLRPAPNDILFLTYEQKHDVSSIPCPPEILMPPMAPYFDFEQFTFTLFNYSRFFFLKWHSSAFVWAFVPNLQPVYLAHTQI